MEGGFYLGAPHFDKQGVLLPMPRLRATHMHRTQRSPPPLKHRIPFGALPWIHPRKKGINLAQGQGAYLTHALSDWRAVPVQLKLPEETEM